MAAAEKYITNFLSGFTEDGYCSEGIGYWNYGYGCFVRLGHMLQGATGGQVDLFAIPKARSAGLFARRMEITPGVYPAFADCSVGSTPSREIMAYVSRHYELAHLPTGSNAVSLPFGGSMRSVYFPLSSRSRRGNSRPNRPAIGTGSKTRGF